MKSEVALGLESHWHYTSSLAFLKSLQKWEAARSHVVILLASDGSLWALTRHGDTKSAFVSSGISSARSVPAHPARDWGVASERALI